MRQKVHSNSTRNYDDDAAALHDDDVSVILVCGCRWRWSAREPEFMPRPCTMDDDEMDAMIKVNAYFDITQTHPNQKMVENQGK